MEATTTIDDGGGSGDEVVVVIGVIVVEVEEDSENNLKDLEAGAFVGTGDIFRFFLPVVKGSNWSSALVETVLLCP